MLRNLLKKQRGFTIIEVMIVLAIAGLILVVVLIAVPQLQRNQRNSARQSILGRVDTELANYSGNNNGNIPDSSSLADVTTRYLANIDINDPSTGQPMQLVFVDKATITVDEVPSATEGQISYSTDVKCDGEKLVDGNARNYAIWTLLEGGAVYCIDNI